MLLYSISHLLHRHNCPLDEILFFPYTSSKSNLESKTMATHDVNSQDEARRGCFLCSLDPKSPCNESQLEGRIVAAQERTIDGTKISIVLIYTGTRRVELHFADPYYRSLVRELKALGDVVGSYNLTLRVYHLPN